MIKAALLEAVKSTITTASIAIRAFGLAIAIAFIAIATLAEVAVPLISL